MDVVIEKDEFLRAYRIISSQLKRKFVKRPNVTDAVEAYESLGRQQLELGFSDLCAACHLAAAHLEQAINSSNANNLFLESARSRSNNLVTISSCYESAINSTPDNKSLAWMTSMEAGQVALLRKDHVTAVSFFQKAFHSSSDSTERNLAGEKLSSSLIRRGDFSDAIKILHIVKASVNTQMTKLLLALNLRKHCNGEAKTCQIIHQTLEESRDFFPPELDCIVDALIHDDEVVDMLPTLWKFLNIDQQQLVMTLCI